VNTRLATEGLRNRELRGYLDAVNLVAIPKAKVQDKDGIVWAAASSGLWRFDHPYWQHLGTESRK